MSQASTREILNQLLGIYSGSFPRYVAQARPWIHAGDQKAIETFQHIAADQVAIMDRISDEIVALDGQPNLGSFPMVYTDTNDLSLQYMVRQAIDCQKADIVAIEECVGALRDNATVSALAEEALGMAKGHLQSLEELEGQCEVQAQSP